VLGTKLKRVIGLGSGLRLDSALWTGAYQHDTKRDLIISQRRKWETMSQKRELGPEQDFVLGTTLGEELWRGSKLEQPT
jgi:hypothetical protein